MPGPSPYVFEWYIFESSPGESSANAQRALRLGPFRSEDECRTLFEHLKRIPRFGSSGLEVHKHRRRADDRLKLEAPITLCHTAGDGSCERVRTLDVSCTGARVAVADARLSPGEVVELRYGGRRAPFQVVWVGTTAGTIGHAGMECLAPETDIWGLGTPTAARPDRPARDIALAHNVQSRLLPQDQPPLRTLDYCGHCIQARSIGGDYYDFLRLGAEEVGFVLADVAGKGISAALLMANLHGHLRALSATCGADLAPVLKNVNRHLHSHSESERYATVFFAAYNDSTRRLRYVNCGHTPPLLLRTDGAVERLHATATVLGMFAEWECCVGETNIERGDVFAMFSDGVTEATDANDNEFGERGLLDVLQRTRHLEASAILREVQHAVEAFRSGEQEDDLTVVIASGR